MASLPEFEPRILCWEVSATLPWLELDAMFFSAVRSFSLDSPVFPSHQSSVRCGTHEHFQTSS